MKKAILIIIILAICIVTYTVYNYNSYKLEQLKLKQLNDEYESFTQSDILGTSLITIINKAVDSNEKNSIEKDENGLYIETENSLRIDIKFLEADNIIPMEAISKLGSEEFMKNYGAMSFRCTQKEYNEKTNNIKYLLFEQI
jgi:hypothetical protein